ncbi:hypothetical protein A9Q87_07045 [Flavobacteriales bacterium 34_180_T64]|nr:hypothetical protein A9Q87_07045 [Flavobacteriales bacterium 34_180_T64]
MKIHILAIVLLTLMKVNAQDENMEKLPYYEIPEASENYTAGTVAARMIDGLGFRYYWATEGLRPEDLTFKPNEDARTTSETIAHVFGLSRVIVNAALKQPNDRSIDQPELDYESMRKQTLINFRTAADILRLAEDLSDFNIVFKSEKGIREFPFWNTINGPIEDAVWHCGQVVLLRRSSGNPFNSKASLFSGKIRE